MARQPIRRRIARNLHRRTTLRPARSLARDVRRRTTVPPKPRAPARPALDALEKRIVAALAPVPKMALDGPWPNRRWTHEIKAQLGALGLERGHAVFADECLGAGAQWLFALCWVDLRQGRMRGVPLAVEIEWNLNMGEIAEDFDKLLQSRAAHRVMVFEQRNAGDVAMIIKGLRARVGAFGARQRGDRFLFAGYAFTEKTFVFDLHVV